jgi:hypothetical protein
MEAGDSKARGADAGGAETAACTSENKSETEIEGILTSTSKPAKLRPLLFPTLAQSAQYVHQSMTTTHSTQSPYMGRESAPPRKPEWHTLTPQAIHTHMPRLWLVTMPTNGR